MRAREWTVPSIASNTATLLALVVTACCPEPSITSVRWTDGDSGTLVRADKWELKFRLKDMDAPETDGRRIKCDAEKQAGLAAHALAQELTASGAITIARHYGTDSTGRRELVDLAVDGQDIRTLLIEAGVAQPWNYDAGEPKPDWCSQN